MKTSLKVKTTQKMKTIPKTKKLKKLGQIEYEQYLKNNDDHEEQKKGVGLIFFIETIELSMPFFLSPSLRCELSDFSSFSLFFLVFFLQHRKVSDSSKSLSSLSGIRSHPQPGLATPGYQEPWQTLTWPQIQIEQKNRGTECPKKQVMLFVKAIIFKPRIARGRYYTHFEADPLRLRHEKS